MIYNKLIKSGCATHRRSVLISDIHTLSQPAHGLPSRSLSYTKIGKINDTTSGILLLLFYKSVTIPSH